MDHELAAIEQYREDAHYAVTGNDEEDDLMPMHTAETITLEGEEDGWELVIVTTTGSVIRVNVHALATTDELDTALAGMVADLADWKAQA